MNKVFFIIIFIIFFNNVYAVERNLELDKLFNQLQTKESGIALKIEKKDLENLVYTSV